MPDQPAQHPVFISYARKASREHAEKLRDRLGADLAFLDSEDIALGEQFPPALVDALFGARVIVIFAEPVYFTRWYCLLEFRIARTPFLRAVERHGSTPQEREEALRGIVIAMPTGGADPMLDRFPALVQARNWPNVADPDKIADLVLAELAANPPTLRERYEALGDADHAQRTLLEATKLPPPMRIGAIPFVPQVGLPTTIGDAFVGRADDLWRIHDVLWTERGDPATAAGLTGSVEAGGGFGKTRLALEYLYRFGPRYFPGGIFWINAEQDAELQLYDVLRALDPQTPGLDALRQSPDGVRGTLARTIRARADAPPPLFIIDNVPEPELDQRPLGLETWCPVLSEVPVLTTSRTRVSLAAGNVLAIPIDTLTPDAAVQLLTSRTAREPLDASAWHEIAEWVGHLPLALELLNAMLRARVMTPRDMLEMSRADSPAHALDSRLKTMEGSFPEGKLRGITEAFSASYDRLTGDEQNAARLIAWLAPTAVPMIVIQAFGPEVFTDRVRTTLINRNFVAPIQGESDFYFGVMHRLLAEFLRSRSRAPDAEIDQVSGILLGVLQSAQGRGDIGQNIARVVAPVVSAFATNWLSFSSAGDRFSDYAEFVNSAAINLAGHGLPELSGDLFADLSRASERSLGEEHPDTLSVMHNLAITLRNRGDLASAQDLQERVLEASRRLLGEEHPKTLVSRSNLANTLSDRGDHTGAQNLHERVLEAMRRLLGEEHPDTLASMNNLAAMLGSRGDLTRAQDLQERVLEARRRLLGEEHPDTLGSMNNLAITLRKRGDHAGAQDLQERVLEARRRLLGEEHPDTLGSMNSLATTLSGQGDHAGAQDLHRRVLETRCRVLGEEHPDTLVSMNNLAATLSDRGDHAGAQDLLERVLEAMRRLLGDEHPNTLASMNNLAATLSGRGDLAGAQALQERVLETRRRVLGEEHPSTTNSAWRLLHIYIALGAQESASRVFQEDLLWLLQREPGTLSGQQRAIRTALEQMVSSSGDGSGADEEPA